MPPECQESLVFVQFLRTTHFYLQIHKMKNTYLVLFASLAMMNCCSDSKGFDWYKNNRYPVVIESAVKTRTTRYYEGIKHEGEWICGKEVESQADPGNSLFESECPHIEYFNKAGNLILTAKVQHDKPVEFEEIQYVSPNSNLIKNKINARSNLINYVIEREYIRDREGHLLKVVKKAGSDISVENEYEYDSYGQRIKSTFFDGDEKTIITLNPGKKLIYSMKVYRDMDSNGFYEVLSEDRIDIYDEKSNLVEQIGRDYSIDDGHLIGNYKSDYKYIGDTLQEYYYDYTRTEGNLGESIHVVYNSHGDVIEEHIVTKDHSLVVHRDIDTDGSIINEEKWFTPTSTAESYRTYQYEYDSNGEWTQCVRIIKNNLLYGDEERATIIVRQTISH